MEGKEWNGMEPGSVTVDNGMEWEWNGLDGMDWNGMEWKHGMEWNGMDRGSTMD